MGVCGSMYLPTSCLSTYLMMACASRLLFTVYAFMYRMASFSFLFSHLFFFFFFFFAYVDVILRLCAPCGGFNWQMEIAWLDTGWPRVGDTPGFAWTRPGVRRIPCVPYMSVNEVRAQGKFPPPHPHVKVHHPTSHPNHQPSP